MKSITKKLFQPLQQTKKGITANLFLAPIGGLPATCMATLIIAIMSGQVTNAKILLYLFMMILPAFLFYLCFFYIPYLLLFLVLQHFHKFNLFNIGLATLFGFLSFYYISYPHRFLDVFTLTVLVLFFILPTAVFFVFLSLKSHKQIMEEKSNLRQKPKGNH
ncbi:hypothetical protein ACE01U_06705 [Acinetobacter sp. BSP-153]|uniref:hypothetical protein n=1 Tax=Acinetobacter sp. BSP-153 TaxID=3344663 RepID=UPI00376F7D81